MSAWNARTRSVLVGVGAVLATLAMMLGPSPASAQEAPPGLIPEGDWTQPEIDWLVDWIDRTEAQLPERFPTTITDGAELEAMGYHNIGAIAPGGYAHWVNSGWLFDDHFLNPNYSESLVYHTNGDGTWDLQAAMYMLAPGVTMEEVPSLISWLPGWHGHPELCISESNGTVVGITDPANPNCPPGSRQGTTPLMLHVWLEDPGCGHRFGGVGVTGLHCDVMHH